MRSILSMAKVAATSALLAAAASTSALAASAASTAFVANVRPNVDFIDLSSRVALEKSTSRALRAFAYREARDETITANSLVAWTQTNTLRGEAVALSGAPVAVVPLVSTVVVPVEDLAALPLGVAASAATAAGDVVTGRSVALAPLTVTPAAIGSAPTVGSALLPAENDDLDRLRLMDGARFNALYKSTQLDALRQLATLYSDYRINGDDPALRAIAVRELPKINARIAELRRL